MYLFVIQPQASEVKGHQHLSWNHSVARRRVDPHRADLPVFRPGALAAESSTAERARPRDRVGGAPSVWPPRAESRRLEPASASDSKIRGFAVDEVAPSVTRRPQKSPVGAKIRASLSPEAGSGLAQVIFVQQ